MPRWVESYWDEEDLTFLWELHDDGYVERHVELEGPDRVPRAAASLAEWNAALAGGTVAAYQARYGVVAEGSVDEWGDFPHRELTAEEFEAAWSRARQAL